MVYKGKSIFKWMITRGTPIMETPNWKDMMGMMGYKVAFSGYYKLDNGDCSFTLFRFWVQIVKYRKTPSVVSLMKNAKNQDPGMGYSNWILPKVALSGSFSKLGRPTFKEGIDEKRQGPTGEDTKKKSRYMFRRSCGLPNGCVSKLGTLFHDWFEMHFSD